ncbi:MAG: protein-glutamate O-methyltransferase CheR [Bacteroidetes bacterium]|nr:protein-glutamate O-methyltransferase CheR [Bacteroidota bacterium]
MIETPGINEPQLLELIELVSNRHGFDFSGYSRASLKRRLSRIIMLKKIGFDQLKQLLADDPKFFQWFLEEITVNVTEMFRDPYFYKALNIQVVPNLTTFPHIRVWSAGCSSGEEVYSLAILLYLSGLGDRSFIYGTDIHTQMLNEARNGVYAQRKLDSYAENYRHAELPGELSDHFEKMNDAARVRGDLRKNTLFSAHNLISDAPFNEFQLISCRNVFIYFEAAMQQKILQLFYESLSSHGFLCLGTKETIRFPEMKNKFRLISSKGNIYQKIG